MRKICAALTQIAFIASLISLVFIFAPLGFPSRAQSSDPVGDPPFAMKVVGHGRPMILIPGLASSADTWAGTVAHFKQHYTCYVLTIAGFDGVPPVQPPLFPKVRDGIAALIRQRHLEKPIIVGHSLGGNIALDLAEHHPKLGQ